MTSQKLWKYHGGLKTIPHRKSLSNAASVRTAKVPRFIVIPLHQHIGKPAIPMVNVGDKVLKGQKIGRAVEFVSAPIHASTSGKVIAIGDRPVPASGGAMGECIVIETDGKDEWIELDPPVKDFHTLDQSAIQEKIRLAGIVGLGGATFPSHVKIPGGGATVEKLIINAAECEPYITCDDMLMRDRPQDVVSGIQVMLHSLKAKECLIGIEDNKPEAAQTLEKHLTKENITNIKVVVTPTVYPTGGEKQLIKILTGKEVPSGGLPLNIGYVVHNVGTAAAIHDAIILGKPIISRLVTVSGAGINEPCNIEVLLGTPIKEVVEQCGGYTDDFEYLLAGGPMMGGALMNDEVPLVKRINAILCGAKGEFAGPQDSMPCVRCGSCANVCPTQLLPQQLYWYARSGELDKCNDLSLFDCIECGCCSFVCPSKIPLVQCITFAKNSVRNEREEQRKAARSSARGERKQARLEKEAAEKAAKKAAKKAAGTGKAKPAAKAEDKGAAITAAVEAAKQKRAAEKGSGGTETAVTAATVQLEPMNQEMKDAMAKAREHLQEMCEIKCIPASQPKITAVEPTADPVKEALAKAKELLNK